MYFRGSIEEEWATVSGDCLPRHLLGFVQGASLEVVGGNAASLVDKFLSCKDDSNMSAWIHVPLSHTASVLLYPFTYSAAES